jgi:hypothetical protein
LAAITDNVVVASSINVDHTMDTGSEMEVGGHPPLSEKAPVDILAGKNGSQAATDEVSSGRSHTCEFETGSVGIRTDGGGSVWGTSDIESDIPANLEPNDVKLPAFLPATVVKYLRAISSSPKWLELLMQYFAFEMEGPPTGISPVCL